MPWKLHPPRKGKKNACHTVRGKYLGIKLNKSTGTREEAAGRRILATWRKQAERGEFVVKPGTGPATFMTATEAYLQAGGSGQHIDPILKAWGARPLAEIDQIALDTLAAELYPTATAATRNRQVYTPVVAVLHHAGDVRKFKRPRRAKGKKSTSWLEREQAFALFEAADAIDPEFGLLCRFLLYTGMRLDEALSRPLRDLKIDRAYCYLPDSKTGEPRGVHLTPDLVRWLRAQPPRPITPVIRDAHGHYLSGKPREDEGVPFLERAPDRKLFRYHDGGALRDMLKAAQRAAGLSFPRRQGGFHLLRHTFGSWMHRYGNLDTHGLARTGAWADPDSADRYVHTQAGEEAKRADLLPVPAREVKLKVV